MFLSANICLKGPVGVYLDHPNISFCKCLSDWFDRCLSELVLTVSFLPMSVWRDLLMSIWTEPNISFCKCLSDGFDQCLSELVLTVSFLPMSVRRNLLMSVWTELACFLASIFLVSSIGVCLKCFPTSFAGSV